MYYAITYNSREQNAISYYIVEHFPLNQPVSLMKLSFIESILIASDKQPVATCISNLGQSVFSVQTFQDGPVSHGDLRVSGNGEEWSLGGNLQIDRQPEGSLLFSY